MEIHKRDANLKSNERRNMFGMKKLKKDLPAIDIHQKKVKGFWGEIKLVSTSKGEQRKLKRILMEHYPDRYYVDDLREWNSIEPRDELSWIDDIEALDAFLDDN